MKPPADVQRWAEKAEELKTLKAEEMAERLALVAKYFPGNIEEGTATVDVGAGHKLAAVFSKAYRLAKEDETRAALDKLRKAEPAGELLAEPPGQVVGRAEGGRVQAAGARAAQADRGRPHRLAGDPVAGAAGAEGLRAGGAAVEVFGGDRRPDLRAAGGRREPQEDLPLGDDAEHGDRLPLARRAP